MFPPSSSPRPRGRKSARKILKRAGRNVEDETGQRHCCQHTQMFHRVSLHRFGVGRECDRISAVSEGLIRLTLVLAMQSFLKPATELCHQWSRSRAICTRGDNDLQCALPAGLVPVSSRRFPRFAPQITARPCAKRSSRRQSASRPRGRSPASCSAHCATVRRTDR